MPLFFGRLDYDDRLGAEQDETLYIGRRHVTGEAGGEPLVIDWRAGMSLPFYRARPGEPMGVRLRRRFGFAHGRLTAYEDEDLTADQPLAASDILESEIERPRTGPMRDIVATIQPEQDVIVRAGLAQSLCVQGAPGTGKTAVGLHRAAFLLYAFRDQLARSGVLVVGPNDSFLSYIGDVLPALGEIDATQATVASLVAGAHGLAIRGVDPVPVALLKGDARMADGAAQRGLVPPRPARRRAGRAPRRVPVAGRRLPRRGDPRRAPRTRASATRPDGRCCRSGWPTRCCCGWRRPGTLRTTGSRTPSPGASRSARTPTPCGRLWTHGSWCSGCSPTPSSWPGRPRACSATLSSRRSCSGRPRVPRPRPGGRWPTRS